MAGFSSIANGRSGKGNTDCAPGALTVRLAGQCGAACAVGRRLAAILVVGNVEARGSSLAT